MSEDRKTAISAARGRQPVTWHPLFPAIVAVWFGALFGLGTLAIRVSLIERVALASGIDQLVPAAAPPLGMTARILIALALALLGGIVGAVVGRTIARSKPATRARRAAAADAAAEVTEPAPLEAGSDGTPAFAPAPSFIDISQLDLGDEHKIESELPATGRDAAAEAIAAADPTRGFHRPLDPIAFPLPVSFPVPGGAAAQRLNAADLDSLSHLELIERLALSLQKRREAAAGEAGAGREPGDDAPPAPPTPEVPSYYPSAPEPIARRFAAAPAADLAGTLEAGNADNRPVALFPAADAGPTADPTAALRQDRAGTERALRDALAALQRMSGVA